MAINLVEGWTEPIGYRLSADGTAFSLGGCTVELLAYDSTNAAITLVGTSSIEDDTLGRVRFVPGAADILASKSPMRIRWKVTDGSGSIAFFPNGTPEIWTVYKP